MTRSLMIATAFVVTLPQVGFSATGRFFNVIANGPNLEITTTVPNHYYPNAGIKLNTPGFSISAGSCSMIGNGYCLFPVSNLSGPTITVSGPGGTLDVLLALNGEGPLTIQHHLIGNRFAYVANNTTTVDTCWINSSSGDWSSCTANTAFSNAVRLVTLNSTATFAYAVEPGPGAVQVCTINPATGLFSSCSDSGATLLNGPNGFVLSSSGRYAYISNYNGNNIIKCDVDTNTGLLSNCGETGSGFNIPTGIVVNPSGSRAYIPSNDLTIGTSLCSIRSSSGELYDCSPLGVIPGTNDPQAITFNAAGTIAYVANGSGVISYCSVQSNGLLRQCTITGSAYSPAGNGNLVINSTGTRAYYPGTATQVTMCSINASTGALSDDCSATSPTFLASVGGLALR